MEPGGLSNLIGVLILVVWLYGTLVLAERRSGQVIILLGSFLGSGIPVIHMIGAGVGGAIPTPTRRGRAAEVRRTTARATDMA